ncbi:MAG: RidA family protein [Alphaproteobacteria bacterium]|uniref:RidA family protein n=1 Tax=Candidatus Nitrobium versatile TaxID=2884831 RepID=A0A953J757_9BACT|nr:RidA family protein [Candidatus Nitrobium versatile]
MSFEARLKELGIELPEAAKPLGSYVPCVRTGNLLFLSGILPLRGGKLTRTGRVGEALSLEEAQQDARQIVVNALSVVRSQMGSLDAVSRCIKLNGFVASGPGFTEQPKVLNAASDLLFEIFGEAGRHARAAVGVYILPLDAPVEIDFVFEVKQ